MSLTTLQTQMFEWICGADVVPEQHAQMVVNAVGDLDASTRVGVYAEMYWLRMRDTLREDFSLVVQLVGEERFDAFVASYIRAHPSRTYTLGRLGGDFPGFLRSLALEDLPWLADLAALQLARAQAFVAEDSAVLEVAALSRIDPETFAHSRLRACPGVSVLSLSFDVLPMWRALAKGAEPRPAQISAKPVDVVVWRKGFEVFHVSIDAREAASLRAVLAGADLPTVCEPYAETEDGAAQAFAAIGSWVGEGMVRALELDAA